MSKSSHFRFRISHNPGRTLSQPQIPLFFFFFLSSDTIGGVSSPLLGWECGALSLAFEKAYARTLNLPIWAKTRLRRLGHQGARPIQVEGFWSAICKRTNHTLDYKTSRVNRGGPSFDMLMLCKLSTAIYLAGAAGCEKSSFGQSQRLDLAPPVDAGGRVSLR